MKRFLTLLAALIIPLAALAQAQITTKKIKISDFPEKTTKVVLTGNALILIFLVVICACASAAKGMIRAASSVKNLFIL